MLNTISQKIFFLNTVSESIVLFLTCVLTLGLRSASHFLVILQLDMVGLGSEDKMGLDLQDLAGLDLEDMVGLGFEDMVGLGL